MMNKVTEEQAEDTYWQGGEFTNTWAQIQANENPNYALAKVELD